MTSLLTLLNATKSPLRSTLTGGGSIAPLYGTVQMSPPVPPPPPDPNQIARDGQIAANLSHTLSDLDYRESRTRQDYGFEDTSNPFNALALLQRSYSQAKDGALNSYASQGQLYSGAYGRAREGVDFNYSKSYDQLSRNYQDALRGIAGSRTTAQDNARLGILDSQGTATTDALNQRPSFDAVQTPTLVGQQQQAPAPARATSAAQRRLDRRLRQQRRARR